MIFWISISVLVVLLRYNTIVNKIVEIPVDPIIDILKEEIRVNIRLMSEYYIMHFIGPERQFENNVKIPTWRWFKICNSPGTPEGDRFNAGLTNYDRLEENFKRSLDPYEELECYRTELQRHNLLADKLFPEVFISINRDKKLNELGFK